MVAQDLRLAFGAEHPFDYDPIYSDQLRIRLLIREVAFGKDPAAAAAEAANARLAWLVADEDHPPAEVDRRAIPLPLVVDWIVERDVIAAQVAFAHRRMKGVEIPIDQMPPRWYRGFLNLLHAYHNEAVGLVMEGLTDHHQSACPRFEETTIGHDGEAYILHCDPNRSTELERFRIRVARADFQALWPAAGKSEQKARLTSAAEKNAVRRLSNLMRANPDKPMPKAELRMQPEFRDLGKNAFDRAFKQAAEETGAPA